MVCHEVLSAEKGRSAILKLPVVAVAAAPHPEKRIISQRMLSHAPTGAEFEVPRTSSHHQFGL